MHEWLKNLRLTLSNAKNPKKVLKKLPLRAEELKQFERILARQNESVKLDDRLTDYKIYLEQIKGQRLELRRPNDHADYSKFKYVGPDGVLHKKPSANPQFNSRFYEKVKKKRISSPRTVSLKSRNNMKCVRHIELLGKHIQKENNVPSGAERNLWRWNALGPI